VDAMARVLEERYGASTNAGTVTLTAWEAETG
jgi:hypothetical protein